MAPGSVQGAGLRDVGRRPHSSGRELGPLETEELAEPKVTHLQPASSRGTLERWEAELLQKNGSGGLNGVYVGRGSKRRDAPGSKWANSFKIGQDGSRSDVVSKFREYITNSALMHVFKCREPKIEG